MAEEKQEQGAFLSGLSNFGSMLGRIGNSAASTVGNIDKTLGTEGPPIVQVPAQPAPVVAAPPPVAAAAPVAQPTTTPPPPTPPVQQAPTPAPMASQTETSVAVAPKLTPKEKQQSDEAFQASLRAVEAESELKAQKAIEVAGANEIRNRQLERQRLQDETDAAEIRKKTDEQAARIEKAIADHAAFAKTQPKQPSLGEGLLGALAAGLGAFGSAMTGAPNSALAIIQKQADKRVADWEREFNTKKGAVDEAQNAYAFFRNKGLDQRAASTAARASILDRAAEKLDYIASSYSNPEILARKDVLKAGILENRVNTLNQQALNEQNKIVSKTISGPAAGPSLENQLKLNALQVDVPQKDASGKVIGTRTYTARSPADAEKVREALVIQDRVKRDAGRLRKLVNDHWQSIPGTTAKHLVSTLTDSLRADFGKLKGLGALSDKDYTLASQVGDTTSILQRDKTTNELLTQFEGGIDGMVEGELRGRGLIR